MRRRSHVREAHCRAAHPVPMVEQVVHIIHMRVGALHRLPQYASVRRGAIDKALAHTLMQHGGDHVTIEILIEPGRSEEHTSELQSLMRISYAVFCLKKKIYHNKNTNTNEPYKNI